MATTFDNTIRGIHVSPGIYTKETEVRAAVKSLGITTLGVAGETLRGPAFEPISVSDYTQYQSVFGGTSPEKFKGTQYPKYELPYIAKSYLTESKQLSVVRVLGLSGYNAGPAWVVKANNRMAVAVLRSRGGYKAYKSMTGSAGNDCDCKTKAYDSVHYRVGEATQSDCSNPKQFNDIVQLKTYIPINAAGNCSSTKIGKNTGDFNVSSTDYGKFKIVGNEGVFSAGTTVNSAGTGYFEYAVSLNPYDKDYILKVLGSSNDDGDAPLFVESLFDVALVQGIENSEISAISQTMDFYTPFMIADYCTIEPVSDLLVGQYETTLDRRYVGQRYLATSTAASNGIKAQKFDAKGKASGSPVTVTAGSIYTVRQYTDAQGKRNYVYGFDDNSDKLVTAQVGKVTSNSNESELVKCYADGLYYKLGGTDGVDYVKVDLNNYRSAYRYASTPWFVSNVKGDYDRIEVNKMFRFHTISDGDHANFEIKVSIENVRPDDGTFDVVVRDITDTDAAPIVLERYQKCTMVPGDSHYISYKIGSFDGLYSPKSKFITVEVNETTAVKNSVPCGFMGYPVPQLNGTPIAGTAKTATYPSLKYNRDFNDDIKNRKQYFGLSDLVGVDIDMFTFKGMNAYIDTKDFVGHGFHLDSRMDLSNYDTEKPKILVDGESGYTFDAVAASNRTAILTNAPVIATEDEMDGSIFEYVNLRKFTAYFYGAFDGWDVYREERSNTNEFKLSKYKGYYGKKSGEGYGFNRIEDPELLQLNQNGITSDWYAYLSGIRQFCNPERVDINVFATPGIDMVNHTLLVQEAISMIEEERADSIYVITTPDKPAGAVDGSGELYTAEDAVYNREETEIDTTYGCTYYPWVKVLDTENNQYVYLPATKDAVRNMAYTDNHFHAWYAPAGITRGDVVCEEARYITKVDDEDAIYSAGINPVKTFAKDGVKLWGQKTLHNDEDSKLSRINIRRLNLRMRKLLAIGCLHLVFDPNDPTLREQFLSIANPIMQNIQDNRGIVDYRIEVDYSEESMDRRELNGKIMYHVIDALEWINLEFMIVDRQISFSELY